jgi:hypothetical protein
MAPCRSTSIPIKRVFRSAQFGPTRMAHQLGGESHVEKAKDQEDRHANVPVYESERRRCGRRSNGDLHRRAGGSRSPTGAVLLDVHRRPARRRRLVEGFEDRDRSDGIDGSLLDSVVPDSRGSRIHGLVGQRASCEERAGAQIGCFRLPVAAIFAFRRSTARIVPSGSGGLHGAFDPPSSGQSGADGRDSRSGTCRRLSIR